MYSSNQIYRRNAYTLPPHRYSSAGMEHRAFIALGSNLGIRVKEIERACREMDRNPKMRVLRTSSLWETDAMYVLDQEKFLNGVCEIETSLSPFRLLDQLQAIEDKMGRVKVIDKGPRNIDLDILLYDEEVFSTERLQIPHAQMLEREFVLRPLCELIPERSLPPHVSLPGGSLQFHLSNLPARQPISSLTPLPRRVPNIIPGDPRRDTRIMSILNLTPDSFSDAGRHFNMEKAEWKKLIKSHMEAGATIIDLGGQSTRPGAVQISSKEEIARVIPAVKIIRSMPQTLDIALSVDTYHADVAEAAIRAGADIINDVSAGMLDDAMLSTVAKLGCTICLMHMRGVPSTMHTLTNYPDGLVETVGRELLSRVQAAEKAGIRRWRIILDPGIGFAKNREQNLELLRRLGELRRYPGLQDFPWLVGTSRKNFVGKVTGVKLAKERKWGTAAAITAAIQGGADIVRVHDVEAMCQVSKMADAVWRV
ncbi:folic acid synthesis protein-like protein [Massarina eburnea CBS 473.64]|uniref:Folic acid synthesis protein FOL1 n=1 Tax=Massarina eburnea CBS 473.64 TaxID=1395130 RepID=A0A6A6RUB0_9PLEO|nr:folic acid synthesis protein-like protein [Massarina eburnea CBS 473.64]